MALNDDLLTLLAREKLGNVLTLGRLDWCGSGRRTTDEALCSKGAMLVHSLDLQCESPTIAYDLNSKTKWKHGQYDTVFDGGTLEHVFDIPNAFRLITSILKVGGVFASHQLLNLAGHGFYTLSPELFFSWFTANGFTDCECLVRSKFPFRRWRKLRWEGKRIELTSLLPIEMYFRARKERYLSSPVVPMQAAPSLTNRWKFLFHEARLYRWKRL